MKREWVMMATVGLGALSAGLVILAGCGGGGGPTTGPETGPGPSPSAEFRALLPEAQKDATYVGSNTCGAPGCHAEARGAGSIHANWSETRHAQANVGCESCHGPGSVHVGGATKIGNILTYPNITRPIVCGQCHGPTHDQFKVSRHAGIVEETIENRASAGKTCWRCHSAQFRVQYIDSERTYGKTDEQIEANIAALPLDPTMKAFEHTSFESATCSSCHAPHQKTGKLTSTGNEAQLRRPTSNTSTDLIGPGATPALYSRYDHICASCHNGRGADGRDDVGLRSTSRPNMHDSNQQNMLLGIKDSGYEGTAPPIRLGSHSNTPDQCVHCHMSERRHTFTVSFDTSCAPCHSPTDAAARATATRGEVLATLIAIRNRMQHWATNTTVLKDAAGNRVNDPDFWDYDALIALDEDDKAKPNQATIPIEIRRARHNYYFVLRDGSFGIHNLLYARHLMTVANNELDKLGVPRSAGRSVSPSEALRILQSDRLRVRAADVNAGHGSY